MSDQGDQRNGDDERDEEEERLEATLRELGAGAAKLYVEQVRELGATPHAKGAMLAALFALGHGVAPTLRLEDWQAWVPRLCDLAIHSAPDFEVPVAEQAAFTSEVAGFALDLLRALHGLAEAEDAGGGEESEAAAAAHASLADLYRRALAVSLEGDASDVRAPVEDAQSRFLTIWSMMREEARSEG